MLKTNILTVALLLLFFTYAGADIAILENGKKLAIQSFQREGESIRLILSQRGEMVVPASWIREIQPTHDIPETKGAVPLSQKQSHEYGEIIRSASRKYRLDWRLVSAVMQVESNFNPTALSPKGAQGLMQLMPETSRLYRVRNPYDPKQNVEAGVKHLRMLLKRFDGDLKLALAAYNSGEKTVDRYGGIPPYQETRDYVRKVIALYQSI